VVKNKYCINDGDYYISNYSTENNEFGNILLKECTKIEKIILPKTIVEIDFDSFWNCSNLTSLIINSKVESIKPFIWVRYAKLNGVKIIDNSNFHFDNSILYNKKYIKIISALQTGFYGDLTIKEGIKEIQDYSFYLFKSLNSIIFLSTLTKIGIYSFWYSGLTSIIFNDSIETIDRNAFDYCYQLKEANLVETKIKTLEFEIFQFSKLENIYLPRQIIKIEISY